MWNTKVAEAKDRYAMTHAPLIVKDKVIVGTAGGDGPIRGFIAAYRCEDRQGSLALLHHPRHPASRATRPGRANRWKTGGGAIWNTGSYDPETNLTFWGIGNPGPDTNRRRAPGRQPV